MGYPLRWNQTDLIYEVTIETIQGRYLLRPSCEVRDLILGVISRAQARYPAVRLYAFVFSRNAAKLLLSSSDEAQFSEFMAYVDGGISRKVGRLLDWSGKLWASRYRALPILDEEAITQRLRHVLAMGVDEGLVESPKDWPGATCVPALLGTMTLDGAWIDRDREVALKAAGLEPPASAYVRPYRVVLTPIPAWAELPRAELVARYHALVESIELEHLVTRKGPVLDPVELQRQDPFFRPTRMSPRQRLTQLCHATCATLIEGFRAAYREFCAAFRAAAGALARPTAPARALVADFPGGCNPRPDLRVPLSDGASPPWWNHAPAPASPTAGDVTLADGSVTELGGEAPTAPWTRVVHRLMPRARPQTSAPAAAPVVRAAAPRARPQAPAPAAAPVVRAAAPLVRRPAPVDRVAGPVIPGSTPVASAPAPQAGLSPPARRDGAQATRPLDGVGAAPYG